MAVRGSDELAALATSFNQMAASLQEKLGELEDLSQVQRQFVSDVSHELRTPLTTIRIAADVLFEAKDDMAAAPSRSAELLQSQLERFESLLTDLLEISRYDANAATLDAEPVDVCDVARQSADVAQQLAERRGTKIEFRLPAEPCIAEVDRRRVERILRNLLVNAVEHGENREAIVTVAGDSAAVAVAVRDFGVGLRQGRSSSSSTGSGAPTRPGPGRRAEPASGWRSRWRTRGCTAAGWRPGASRAAARCSGSRCRACPAMSSSARRCRWRRARPSWTRRRGPAPRPRPGPARSLADAGPGRSGDPGRETGVPAHG